MLTGAAEAVRSPPTAALWALLAIVLLQNSISVQAGKPDPRAKNAHGVKLVTGTGPKEL